MCETKSMVCNVLDALHAPLIAQIDLAIDFYGADEITFYQPLTKSAWMLEQPYCGMQFEYEHAEFTLIQLCNIVQMMHGFAAEAEFVQELTVQIKEHVEGRLQLRIEKDMQEEQEKLNYELSRRLTA